MPLLSLNLPLTPDRYPNERTRAFLDALLPEGEPRLAIAASLDLQASDVFGLLETLGRDCAGAVVIQPRDEPPPIRPTTATAERLSSDELAELVAKLRSAPLGIGRKVRLSLAGVQEKLLLTRMPDGQTGSGAGRAKARRALTSSSPRSSGMRTLSRTKPFACGLLATSGSMSPMRRRPWWTRGQCLLLSATTASLVPTDRSRASTRKTSAKHSAYPPNAGTKRTAVRRSRPSRVSCMDVADPGAAETFLRALTLNVALGNCDAHAKNFSLLHSEAGTLRLAPV